MGGYVHPPQKQNSGGPSVQFSAVFVDEAQDLLLPQLQLFQCVARRETTFCFSYDAAQTIHVGRTFRPAALKQLWYHGRAPARHGPSHGAGAMGTKDIVLQLTKNHRTHQGVLDFSSRVLELLEIFDGGVERQAHEVSDTPGVAPVMLLRVGRDEFAKMLRAINERRGEAPRAATTARGEVEQVGEVVGKEVAGGPKMLLGADQAVIVRSAGVKDVVRRFLGEQVVVLTPQEAKGLEYSGVLLWDFVGGGSPAGATAASASSGSAGNGGGAAGGGPGGSSSGKNNKKAAGPGKKANASSSSRRERVWTKVYQPFLANRANTQEAQQQIDGWLAGRSEDSKDFITSGEMVRWCAELKNLYVACTRARRQLLFFESELSSGSGASQALQAVERLMSASREFGYDRSALRVARGESGGEAISALLEGFVEDSRKEDWLRRGNDYMEQVGELFGSPSSYGVFVIVIVVIEVFAGARGSC